MTKFLKLEDALLDEDGSCRDVNFLKPTWDGVTQFVNRLEQAFGERIASDGEGNSLAEPHWKDIKAAVLKTGSVHMVYRNCTEILNNLQVYVGREDDKSPFIELTFSPRT